MPEIPASEYLNSLLVAYQNAEKMYGQAVSDLIAAEIRRDEARRVKDEAMARLEEAREKYATNDNGSAESKNSAPRRNSQGGGRRKMGIKQSSKKMVAGQESGSRKPVAKKAPVSQPAEPTPEVSPAVAASPRQSMTAGNILLSPKESGSRKPVAKNAPVSQPAEPTPEVSPAVAASPRQSMTADNILLSPTAGMKKVSKIFTAIEESAKRKSSKTGPLVPVSQPAEPTPEVSPVVSSPRQSMTADNILLSPTAGMKKLPKIFTANGESPKRKSSKTGPLVPVSQPAEPTPEVSPVVSSPRPSMTADNILLSPTAGMKKLPKIFTANGDSPKRKSSKTGPLVPVSQPAEPTPEVSPVVSSPRKSMTADNILLSPTAGMKKVPKIFTANGDSAKRKSSRIGPLVPVEGSRKVLEIAKGRTRDWYDKNFDCEACGLVKKFYQAAFGTKTNEKTGKVTVRTIVLNDEWNDLVNDTSQIQEFYVGASVDDDAKPNNLRDRAAEALVNPLQADPVALFFAPKISNGTSEIFYGGHWKVVDGKMLHPPRSVKGQPRQCLARFVFAGVDQSIVEALNKSP